MRGAPRAADRDRRSAALDWLWLAVWIGASSVWCLTAAAELGVTFDEPLYVTRGLDGWRTGSHAALLRVGTMPLAIDLQTLPLFLSERWRGRPFDIPTDLVAVLPWARAVTLLFWWALLGYGWRVGRALGGRWGARLAVAWLACEPNLLAHASLATTDLALATCLLALAYHFRAGREADWVRRIGLPALWFGAAVLAKASGLVIGVLCLAVIELERRWAAQSDRALVGHARDALADIASIAGLGLLLTVLYCGSDWQAEPSFVAWAHALPDASPLHQPIVWLAEHLRIFTNAGDGLVRQIRHNIRGHGTFLLEHAYPRAYWLYFPILLTLKLSEPLLLAGLLVAVVRRRALLNWPLLLAAVLVVYSVTFRVQLGVRMVLPIVVFAVIGLAAALVEVVQRAGAAGMRRALAAAVAAGTLWNAAVALAIWPEGLAYINRFWGGSAEGYRLASDSNYDWGQGVVELRRWREEHADAPLAVWYFGTDPRADQPPLRILALHALPIASADDVRAFVRGGRLAASTTLLYGSGLDGEAYRQSLQFLRGHRPVARTTTFLIYDFTAD